MKIRVFISTLSCITKSIRIFTAMINKKIVLSLILCSFLGACTTPTAMLGPAYTLTSTGNIAQAGLTYGSNVFITSYTGKSPIENLEDISSKNLQLKKNIQKQTLESDDFYQLVKSKIESTKGKIIISNQ
tara:strand:+ start:494 stop:883 length:390 start_codon:yes stop_codon:yes gene_type:complete